MVQNFFDKIPENFNFAKNRTFIKESSGAAVRGCSGINSQENTCGRGLL